jgi:hypothetical protein
VAALRDDLLGVSQKNDVRWQSPMTVCVGHAGARLSAAMRGHNRTGTGCYTNRSPQEERSRADDCIKMHRPPSSCWSGSGSADPQGNRGEGSLAGSAPAAKILRRSCSLVVGREVAPARTEAVPHSTSEGAVVTAVAAALRSLRVSGQPPRQVGRLPGGQGVAGSNPVSPTYQAW